MLISRNLQMSFQRKSQGYIPR